MEPEPPKTFPNTCQGTRQARTSLPGCLCLTTLEQGGGPTEDHAEGQWWYEDGQDPGHLIDGDGSTGYEPPADAADSENEAAQAFFVAHSEDVYISRLQVYCGGRPERGSAVRGPAQDLARGPEHVEVWVDDCPGNDCPAAGGSETSSGLQATASFPDSACADLDGDTPVSFDFEPYLHPCNGCVIRVKFWGRYPELPYCSDYCNGNVVENDQSCGYPSSGCSPACYKSECAKCCGCAAWYDSHTSSGNFGGGQGVVSNLPGSCSTGCADECIPGDKPAEAGDGGAPPYAIRELIWTQPTAASIWGDPHVHGADGDSADFKGADGGIYSLLSAPDLSFTARFRYADFVSPYSRQLVHGSFVRGAYWNVRVPSTGRVLRVSFTCEPEQRAIEVVDGDGDEPADVISHVRGRWTRRHCSTSSAGEGALPMARRCANSSLPMAGRWTLRRSIDGGDVEIALANVKGSTRLTLATRSWRTVAECTAAQPHHGIRRLNVKVHPKARSALAPVAPHGLLGQTFDGDGLPINGHRDDYTKRHVNASRHHPGGVISTLSLGEGAFEGSADDYRLPDASPFATAFKYSRFAARGVVPPRDATAMRAGRVGPKRAAPVWDPAGGVDKLVPHLNFVGSDLNRGRAKTAEACYNACAKTRGCAAFTFITSPGFNEKARHGHDRCWLKKAGFERGAEYSSGTISGVVAKKI